MPVSERLTALLRAAEVDASRVLSLGVRSFAALAMLRPADLQRVGVDSEKQRALSRGLRSAYDPRYHTSLQRRLANGGLHGTLWSLASTNNVRRDVRSPSVNNEVTSPPPSQPPLRSCASSLPALRAAAAYECALNATIGCDGETLWLRGACRTSSHAARARANLRRRDVSG